MITPTSSVLTLEKGLPPTEPPDPKASLRILCLWDERPRAEEVFTTLGQQNCVVISWQRQPCAGGERSVSAYQWDGVKATPLLVHRRPAWAELSVSLPTPPALGTVTTGHKLRLFSSCQPFDAPLETFAACFAPSPQHGLLLPACGLAGEAWYDGWVAHITPAGTIASLLPPGSPLRLTLPLPLRAPDDSLSWQEALSYMPQTGAITRAALLAAVQHLPWPLTSDASLALRLPDFSVLSALSLVLLRQAFPKQRLAIVAPTPMKLWPQEWRLLPKALSLQPLLGAAEAASLDAITRLIPSHLVGELFETINGMSRVLAGFKTTASSPLPPEGR